MTPNYRPAGRGRSIAPSDGTLQTTQGRALQTASRGLQPTADCRRRCCWLGPRVARGRGRGRYGLRTGSSRRERSPSRSGFTTHRCRLHAAALLVGLVRAVISTRHATKDPLDRVHRDSYSASRSAPPAASSSIPQLKVQPCACIILLARKSGPKRRRSIGRMTRTLTLKGSSHNLSQSYS